jgi:hypothetical protein
MAEKGFNFGEIQHITDPFPPPTLPTVYVDAVANLQNSAGLARFYFTRLDPNITGAGSSRVTPVAQVIMPLPGFVATALFFKDQLDQMVKSGLVPQAMIEQLRAHVTAEPDQ